MTTGRKAWRAVETRYEAVRTAQWRPPFGGPLGRSVSVCRSTPIPTFGVHLVLYLRAAAPKGIRRPCKLPRQKEIRHSYVHTFRYRTHRTGRNGVQQLGSKGEPQQKSRFIHGCSNFALLFDISHGGRKFKSDPAGAAGARRASRSKTILYRVQCCTQQYYQYGTT